MGSIPGLGRCPGEGNGNPLQNSCLENPTNRGAGRAIVRRAAQSLTRLKGLRHTLLICGPQKTQDFLLIRCLWKQFLYLFFHFLCFRHSLGATAHFHLTRAYSGGYSCHLHFWQWKPRPRKGPNVSKDTQLLSGDPQRAPTPLSPEPVLTLW